MVRRMMALSVALSAILACVPSGARAAEAPAGAQRLAGGWAVPLSTEGPAWFDLDYYRRVVAAGTKGARLPSGVSMPAAAGLATEGIRPGQWLVTVTTNPIGFAWCSANFVFRTRTSWGIGTAGHCAARDALGSFPDVTAYVVPPTGQGSPGFYHIGKFALARNRGIGDDFAMIRLYSTYARWLNPTMPVWGGPVGTYRSTTPTVVEHFGHGAVVGAGGTPRAGFAPIWTARRANAFAWYGAGMEGDSGSGVRVLSGEAAGNFTHIVITDDQMLTGMLAGTRIARILAIARGWSLVNGKPLPV
jgi:hypothetical protein